MRSNPPGVEFFYAAKLIRLEARGVSYYVLDGSCPPVTQLTKLAQHRELAAIGFALKLQEE